MAPSFDQSIMSEIVRINTVCLKNKISKRIAKESLIPLLKTIKERANEVAEIVGETVVAELRNNIINNTVSGGTYEVVRVTRAGDKNSYETIGTYNSSASRNPPNSIKSANKLIPPTGTLLSSIDYNILDNGRVEVGLFRSTGTEFKSLFFKGGKIFVSENEGKATSVLEYSKYLETGTGNMEPRPWFTSVFDSEFKENIRKLVNNEMHKIVRQETRSKTIQASMYFRTYYTKEYTTEMFGDEW